MKRRWLLLAITVAALVGVAAPMVAYADKVAVTRSPIASRAAISTSSGSPPTAGSSSSRATSRRTRSIAAIWGVTGDTRLVGIDYRPATGELIGLGDQGGVYAVSDFNAQATKKSQLGVALAGTSFGVDFNPTVDRLRVISDTGQNLRVNVDNGVTNVDTPLSSMGVTGAGYTNNDADPNTATTFFDLDSALDQVVVQSPANSGMLAATGKLGVDAGPAIGFDVYSAIRNGTTVSVRAFASLNVDGSARFYRINLLQGRAGLVGAFSASNQVTGIAVKLDQGEESRAGRAPAPAARCAASSCRV